MATPARTARELEERPWPSFTEAQVSFLEWLVPQRCIAPNETLEEHLRYAGAAHLVATIRSRARITEASGEDPKSPAALERIVLEEDDDDDAAHTTIPSEDT